MFFKCWHAMRHYRRVLFLSSSIGVFTVVSSAYGNATRFKVLAFFNASWDLGHISFAHEANRWFPRMGELHNFQYDSTKNWSDLNASKLAEYQVVIFLDGQPPSNQRAAFQKYMEDGGGFIGFHVVAFNQNPSEWDWYYNRFLGMGSFKGNTWAPTSAILDVEDQDHPVTRGMPLTFTSQPNEWYSWTVDLRTLPHFKILCSINPGSFPLGTGPKEWEIWHSGYYPVVWTNTDYKMIYSNMGHNDIDYGNNNRERSFTFENETQNQLIINALLWMGRGDESTRSVSQKNQNHVVSPALQIAANTSHIGFDWPGSTGYQLTIYDLQGRVTLQKEVKAATIAVAAARLGSGVYTATASTQGRRSSKQFTIR